MDETIPFDNVKRILTAPSTEALRQAIVDGGDHRYGRILYNVSALVAWLPHRLAGDPGIIVAVRSTQVALLLGAMVVLCLGLIRTWLARAIALLAMACLPYTDYYLTMPKPEPVQLLCYAWFLVFAVRRRFAFGWHWIWLGLAFGAKISAAPFCAAAAMLTVAHLWLFFPGWKRTLTSGFGATIAFLAGWIMAIPMLAIPNRTNVESYLNWTFRATGHGSDDSRITFLEWAKSMFGGEVVRWFIPPWVAVVLLAVVALFLLLALTYFGRRSRCIRDVFEFNQAWLVLGLATALLIPIMIMVKRLWGFYLFPGQILAIVALVGIAERWLAGEESQRAWQRIRWIAVAALVGSTLLAGSYSGRNALHQYDIQAHRTRDVVYLRQQAVFDSAVQTLTALAQETHRQNDGTLSVWYDPFLFLPDSQPDMTIQVFWELRSMWIQKPAAIVFGRQWHLCYFLHEKPLPPSSAANFAALQEGVELFAANVESDPAALSTKPYQLVQWFGEDAALLVRRDLVERWRSLPARPPGREK